MKIDGVVSEFTRWSGGMPRIFSAPGRVNVIGEHTDYNDGFVMPSAINFRTIVAIRPRTDRLIRVRSIDLGMESAFSLDDPVRNETAPWMNYPVGVAAILEREGFRLGGADVMTSTNIPIGAGLSSSAAFEVSLAVALASTRNHMPERWEIARIGQTAEHEFAGVRSGIMDQFASVFGRAGHALFLDCRSLEWQPVPLGRAGVVVCNTRVRHELADGEYNRRREECETAATLLGVSSLRDARSQDNSIRELPDVLRRRARHVLTENERVLAAVESMNQGNLRTLGQLMNESHASLKEDFEVSCRELDVMAGIVRRQAGIYGARMTGGGFGGCVIGLYEDGISEDFAAIVSEEYFSETGVAPEVYLCHSVDGVAEIQVGSECP